MLPSPPSEKLGDKLLDLTVEQRSRLTKMGDKSEAFCRQALITGRQNAGKLPTDAAADLTAEEADLAALDKLRPRLARLTAITEKSDDTEVALGQRHHGLQPDAVWHPESHRCRCRSGRAQGSDGCPLRPWPESSSAHPADSVTPRRAQGSDGGVQGPTPRTPPLDPWPASLKGACASLGASPASLKPLQTGQKASDRQPPSLVRKAKTLANRPWSLAAKPRTVARQA